MLPAAIALVVVLIAGGVGFFVLGEGGSDEAAAAEVLPEPVEDAGPDPFMSSMAVIEIAEFPAIVEAAIDDTREELPSSDGVLVATGTTPGLYGGSSDETVCDPDTLVAFLDEHPDEAAAWASVQGIEPSEIGDYVASLASVVLTNDTWVTNHGFVDGAPTPRQAVLQAGTAVMVDDRGVPRVKCGCGNPLLPPERDDVSLDVPAWEDYDPEGVTVVDPGPTEDTLEVIDVEDGELIEQPVGGTAGDRFEQIQLGIYRACGILVDGSIHCWGDYTTVGDPPSGEFTDVAVAAAFSCALGTDEDLTCWGTPHQTIPDGSGPYVAIDAYSSELCAVGVDGSLSCWGSGSSPIVNDVPDGTFTDVSIEGTMACAIRTDAAIACWGWDTTSSPEFSERAGPYTAVSVGGRYVCAIRDDGTIECWGYGPLPEFTPPSGEFTAIATGDHQACAVDADGAIVCWGESLVANSVEPPSSGEFTAVSARNRRYCAIRVDGTLACWGIPYPGESPAVDPESN